LIEVEVEVGPVEVEGTSGFGLVEVGDSEEYVRVTTARRQLPPACLQARL
jgi:hypothetical protein